MIFTFPSKNNSRKSITYENKTLDIISDDLTSAEKVKAYQKVYNNDGLIDEQLTEEYTALYGDIISEYVDKAKENYILGINNPVNVPLVISEKDNVIKVYYVYDEGEIIPPYTGKYR